MRAFGLKFSLFNILVMIILAYIAVYFVYPAIMQSSVASREGFPIFGNSGANRKPRR